MPLTQADISEDYGADCEALASLLKASGDQLRLEVLRVLNQESFGVLELCTIFNIKQSAMSHHLKVLATAGLVTKMREGNSIFYRRAHQALSSALIPLQKQLFRSIDQLHLPTHVQKGVTLIQQNRMANSQRFFEENAHKFREQQDLIASLTHYGDSVKALLDSVPLPSRQTALEIGPGDGAFLGKLSQRFEQVIAIDSSAEMLNRATELVKEEDLSNVQLIHADTSACVQRALSADCIVVNMVLHHTPSPADIFRDLSTCLKPGGALLICDLCHHNQSWVQESCGDLWLGFEPEDLNHWASNVNLTAGQDMYLALRNGFRIQVRHFFKSK